MSDYSGSWVPSNFTNSEVFGLYHQEGFLVKGKMRIRPVNCGVRREIQSSAQFDAADLSPSRQTGEPVGIRYVPPPAEATGLSLPIRHSLLRL